MNAVLLWTLLSLTGLDSAHTVSPNAPFAHTPDETTIRVDLSAGPAAGAQERLDAARAADPGAVLCATVHGRIEVSDRPLRIGSRTIVSFGDGAEVVAVGDVADALLEIAEAEFVTIRSVGIQPAVFSGGAVGIRVTHSERVHIDRIAIEHSRVGCLLTGRSATGFARGFSISRVLIRHCGTGIDVSSTAQFQCHDNTVLASDRALRIDSSDAMLVNNEFRGHADLRGPLNVVARNLIRGRLMLAAGSSGAYVAENELDGGLTLGGERHAVYRNRIRDSIVVGGADHTFCGNSGSPIPPTDAALVFDPPTQTAWHEREVLAGAGRHDIVVQGTDAWTFPRWEALAASERPVLASLSVAREAVDAAVAEHPDAIVVVRLKGLFEATEEWALPPNVCIVLDGAIRAAGAELDHRTADDPRDCQLIRFPTTGVASLSGGVIDAAFLPYHVLNMPGAARIVLDGITVKRAGFNGITTKGHNHAGRPVFIRDCTVVNCANRGIWVHVCKNVHVLDCVSAGNGSDGIDYDAFGHETTGLFNVCTGNRRHGMFIEEGVKHVRVFGNRLDGNWACGVAIWDEAVVGNTGWNSVVANTCRGNGNGIAIGGRSAEKTSNENLVYANTIKGNRKIGLRTANRHSYSNYCAHNRLADNPQDVVNHSPRPMTDFWNGACPKRDL